ncbi:MAG: hypothetical protein IJM37_10865 [Lachnospiraceae bacterium]|nr:hypothetical protein [Lachnospiraceae bacterium]
MLNAFRDGVLRTTGTDFDLILPPASRFGGTREKVKTDAADKLKEYFDKYYGLITGDMTFDESAAGSYGEKIEYAMVAERNEYGKS